MPTLPRHTDSYLIRPDFTDAEAWPQALSAIESETADGFRADVTVVDDPAWANVDWAQARQAVITDEQHQASVLFLVDSVTLGAVDHPAALIERR